MTLGDHIEACQQTIAKSRLHQLVDHYVYGGVC